MGHSMKNGRFLRCLDRCSVTFSPATDRAQTMRSTTGNDKFSENHSEIKSASLRLYWHGWTENRIEVAGASVRRELKLGNQVRLLTELHFGQTEIVKDGSQRPRNPMKHRPLSFGTPSKKILSLHGEHGRHISNYPFTSIK